MSSCFQFNNCNIENPRCNGNYNAPAITNLMVFLNDEYIGFFVNMMKYHTFFNTVDTLYLTRINLIYVHPKDEPHIQILHSRENVVMSSHWICSYYNGKSIFIYDPLNMKTLQDDHIAVLSRRVLRFVKGAHSSFTLTHFHRLLLLKVILTITGLLR